MNNISLIAFTQAGCTLARDIARGLVALPGYEQAHVLVAGPARYAASMDIDAYEDLATWTAQHFSASDALIFVGASGIAVRAIAPYVRDKFTDPAVVSVDETGKFVVPLLSGHVGGANDLARKVAEIVQGQAAISTATDVNKLFAVDEWAARNGLVIRERSVAKEISAALLEGRPVGFQSDFDIDWELPRGLTEGAADIGFVVSLSETVHPFRSTLHLIPPVVTVGVGCRQNTPTETLYKAVYEVLSEARVSPLAVSMMASIDVKKNEPALHEVAASEGWALKFYSAEELAAVPGSFSSSEFVERTVGVGNVCERAACAEGAMLLVGKQAGDGVTVALAFKTPMLAAK